MNKDVLNSQTLGVLDALESGTLDRHPMASRLHNFIADATRAGLLNHNIDFGGDGDDGELMLDIVSAFFHSISPT